MANSWNLPKLPLNTKVNGVPMNVVFAYELYPVDIWLTLATVNVPSGASASVNILPVLGTDVYAALIDEAKQLLFTYYPDAFKYE
jgi:hypothetical protein